MLTLRLVGDPHADDAVVWRGAYIADVDLLRCRQRLQLEAQRRLGAPSASIHARRRAHTGTTPVCS